MKCYQMSSKMWSNVRLKMWPNVTENVGECHWMSSNVKKCRKMWLKCQKKVTWHCHWELMDLVSSLGVHQMDVPTSVGMNRPLLPFRHCQGASPEHHARTKRKKTAHMWVAVDSWVISHLGASLLRQLNLKLDNRSCTVFPLSEMHIHKCLSVWNPRQSANLLWKVHPW